MEFVLGTVLLVGVISVCDAVYQIIQTHKESKIFSQKHFHPLNFDEAICYHFIKDPNEKNVFNIFDGKNLLMYKLLKKQRQRSYFKEEWIIVKATDQHELATITVAFNPFGKSHVYFNLSNRYSDPARFSNSAGVQAPHSQAAPSSRLTTLADHTPIVTPYVDSSLAVNAIVSPYDLGPTLFIKSLIDLKRYEVRNLYKIAVNTQYLTKSSNFKISKNSMIYSWKANGYLEKTPKTDLDLSCVRIGMVRFNNTSGTDFLLYVNQEMIEGIVAITTAFLQYKLSMWNFENLS